MTISGAPLGIISMDNSHCLGVKTIMSIRREIVRLILFQESSSRESAARFSSPS